MNGKYAEKFNGRLDFLTHLGLRTPIINGETLEMNGENLRTYFLPFFNGSQEQLEKALVKSVKVVAKDNKAYMDSLGMGDYDDTQERMKLEKTADKLFG